MSHTIFYPCHTVDICKQDYDIRLFSLINVALHVKGTQNRRVKIRYVTSVSEVNVERTHINTLETLLIKILSIDRSIFKYAKSKDRSFIPNSHVHVPAHIPTVVWESLATRRRKSKSTEKAWWRKYGNARRDAGECAQK